jgi:hypothetical protein
MRATYGLDGDAGLFLCLCFSCVFVDFFLGAPLLRDKGLCLVLDYFI